MAAIVLDGIFTDEMVTATDLNRHAGDVLNRARLRPVTISRNNEQFALMRREVVGKLIRGHTCLKRSTELIGAAWKYSQDGRASTSYEWLSAFDGAELQEMAGEIISAIARAIESEEWASVESVIHEWQESALAITSGVLHSAMRSEPGETPIPPPTIGENDATTNES
jgi:hypothetical protein